MLSVRRVNSLAPRAISPWHQTQTDQATVYSFSTEEVTTTSAEPAAALSTTTAMETPTTVMQIDSTSLETVIQSAVQASVAATSEAIFVPCSVVRDPGQALPATPQGRAVPGHKVTIVETRTTTAAEALAYHQGLDHHTNDGLDRPVAVPTQHQNHVVPALAHISATWTAA